MRPMGERLVVPGCRAEYRQKFKIKGFRFGGGEKACAMVSAVRGNEVQQIHALREEGDRADLSALSDEELFLSTPSARRATCR